MRPETRKMRETEKKVLERLMRKLFRWNPDESGKKLIEINMSCGSITMAQEIESRKVATFDRLA